MSAVLCTGDYVGSRLTNNRLDSYLSENAFQIIISCSDTGNTAADFNASRWDGGCLLEDVTFFLTDKYETDKYFFHLM